MTYDYVSRVLSYVKSGSLEISYDSTPLVRIEAEKNQRMIDILSDVKKYSLFVILYSKLIR